jgi:outer membrane lipoprotein-sorting protein
MDREPRRPLGWLGVLLLAATTAGAASAPPPLEQILERVERASRETGSLTATFTQVRSFPMLDMEDPPESGTIALDHGSPDGSARVRLEVVEPDSRIVTLSDGHYTFYQPGVKQAVVGKVDERRKGGRAEAVRFLLGDLSGAGEDYEMTLGDEDRGGRGTVRLRLEARGDGKPGYARVDLWIDRELWIPVRQELVEFDRSVTRLELHDIVVGVELADDLFHLDLPPDVERVRG